MTSGVSIHHLTLNEYDVGGYRTFFRFTPSAPRDDRLAMIEGRGRGLIDVIASFHTRRTRNRSVCPLPRRRRARSGCQTLLPAAMRFYQQGGLQPAAAAGGRCR